MSADAYVYASSLALGDELDLTHARGLVIADAHARYRRAIGDEVLFAPALVGEDTDGRAAELRRVLDALSLSCDWERAAATGDPDLAGAARWLFAKLVEAGLAYQRGEEWFLRMGSFNEENNRRVDDLDGWSDAARSAQRELLHRVDGFDFDAQALDGTTLSVFTGHPDSVADAEFVGLSTRHPELERWLEDADVRGKVERLRSADWAGKPLDQMPAVEIGMSVQVPSVAQPLPVLVSPAIDARFGIAAILGIPGADPVDKALAKSLPKLGGLAWKVESKPPKTTPAHRYLVDDMPLATGDAAHPRLHPRLTAALLVFALATPKGRRAESIFDGAELGRWLPAERSVVPADAALSLLDIRTVAKAVRDVTEVDVADGEPLGTTLAYGSLALEGVSLADAIDRHGADAVRFALLDAAAPAKPFAGTERALEQASGFLRRALALGEARLGEPVGAAPRIDLADGLRRRLAGWCDTAVERVGENLDRLDTHRATRNSSELLNRIEDFERRVTEHRREVAGADADASAAALVVLARLLAPLAPDTAAELLQRGGSEGPPDAVWPERQRAPAAA